MMMSLRVVRPLKVLTRLDELTLNRPCRLFQVFGMGRNHGLSILKDESDPVVIS